MIAGPHVRDACARHLRDLKEAKKRGLVWDLEAAERAIQFFPDVLRLAGGEHEGEPFVLQPPQAFIVGSLFGWKRKTTGYRRFRVAFIETGKGSGKTPLAAGVGLQLLMADDEPRAEIYAAAVDKEQAGILFRDAVAMAKQSPEIFDRVEFSGGDGKEYNMAYLETGSFFRPISSESRGRGKSGYRPHGVLLDEIHEHPTNAMVEFMRAGTKGRRQALILMITNSGAERASVCFEYHEMGRKVAAGEIEDDSFFAYICAVDEGEDPLTDPVDPKLGVPRSWMKANPLLGVTFPVAYLEEQVRAAKEMPSKENIVRRLNFCQWTESWTRWIGSEPWKKCAASFALKDMEGEDCYAAIDLSSTGDTTCAHLVFPKTEKRKLRLWPIFFIPEEGMLERERRDGVPYGAWVRAGHVVATPGNVVDYGYIRHTLNELVGRFNLIEVPYDPWNATQLATQLAEEDGFTMVHHQQGFASMNAPAKEFERLVMAGELEHPDNPVLNWQISNATVRTDPAGNIKPDKERSTGRIDGVVAGVMGVGRAMVAVDGGPTISFAEDYEDEAQGTDEDEEEDWLV